MTKREQIAAKMMAALVARCDNASAERMARGATRYADALLAELELTPTSEDSSSVDTDKDVWIPHKPGDPMPCNPGTSVLIRLGDQTEFFTEFPEKFVWQEIPDTKGAEIIAWKPFK